ncbi:PREDICTED: UV-stimulated scaffold protein A [Gekko japonicus]|uniref:UV-stimulated scaffold protein A n=1 Tax=Gekko japonicus TaxID=146911 RepID=A0ABM1JVT5_GEKJA|nr:PREDICTED: UV-stimulated scaffold protein A [Gekko japonicus]
MAAATTTTTTTLAGLVEALTTAGGPEPEPRAMKELKRRCKASPEEVGGAYRLLLGQLAAEHAEVRLGAFRVLEQLFCRSAAFRARAVADLPELLALTLATDLDRPLPPPAPAAQQLRAAALRALRDWHRRYGTAYPGLDLACRFLQRSQKVDFEDIGARTLVERRRNEDRQKRLDIIYKNKAQRAGKELEDMSPEIEAVLTEMENCFRLLLPDLFDFTVNDMETTAWRVAEGDQSAHSPAQVVGHPGPFLRQVEDEQPCCSRDLPSISCAPEGDDRDSGSETEADPGREGSLTSKLTSGCLGGDDDNDDAAFVRHHGLGSHKYTLNLEISTDVKLQENEDNMAIINTVTDAHKLIKNKFLPSVQSWIQVFTRAGISDDRLRRAIDLKTKLESALEKHKEMNIEYKEKTRKVTKASDDSSDDEEFVDVPAKEGYEPRIPDHLREEYGLDPLSPPETIGTKTAAKREPKQNEDELDPTCAAATWKIVHDKLPRAQPPNTRNSEFATSGEHNKKHEEEKSKAPIVPFGLDLFYWGQEQPTAGKILKVSSQHRFWAPNEMEEEVENKDVAGMLKSRCVTFAGTFEPVQHKCRAPMPSGGLCGRQDRVKCPFHGKIIPRDELGSPVNPEDREREAKKQFEQQEKQPEWQDPEFMREVEAATGVDLGSSRYTGKGGKNKGKKKKYPNLTDLKQQANTSRSRLEKKVFDKAAMKRVVKAMNRVDQRKHEKFANQFNYALN